MDKFRLSVIVPTRNRPDSVARLLRDMCGQTLTPRAFEVLVVDDGSTPPLDERTIAADLPFSMRVIRRTSGPGAHASRFEGLREAQGRRVVFLDDDVLLEPEVLAEHADAQGVFAIGPILYHPETKATAYQRFQSKRYADYAAAVADQHRIPVSDIYICNSSGPREAYMAVFDGVDALVRGLSIPGDGMDEELICYQLRDSEGSARFLSKALILHFDTKTVAEARREKFHRAKVQCRLLLQFPELSPSFLPLAASYRKPVVKLLWKMPGLFRFTADVFTWIADLPGRWVPTWTCYPPMAIAFWEGMNAAAPRYKQLEAVLFGAAQPD